MKKGKKQIEVRKSLDSEKKYSIADALVALQKSKTSNFDETVDFSVRLGVDAKQSNQQVRGSCVMPKGLGKTKRVLVIAKGEKEKEAQDAGADFVGGQDMIDKISGGWLDFDVLIVTPDMMGLVGRVGKVLGPRGLMPNPKVGTVTFDIKKAVEECKAGKIEFRTEKAGIIHGPIGKVSFSAEDLAENLSSVLKVLKKLKPQTSKGVYFKSVTLSSTMGPGFRVDLSEVNKIVS